MNAGARHARWIVGSTWDGHPIRDDERAIVDATLDDAHLVVEVRAPYHGDAPPGGPVGHLDGLWNHEVVELFLLGSGDRYLEIELSPHGHFLVLELDGPRHVVGRRVALDFAARIEKDTWLGRATAPRSWLPPGLSRANAYAIHGTGADRRHLAAHPPGGERPDFHRLGAFAAIPWRAAEG